MNIHQRLHKVMEAVGYVQKENKKVNGQYTFVSHDAVSAAIRPALLTNGVVTVVSVDKHSQDGNRTEVDISVKFMNVEKPDDFIEVKAFGYGIDPQDKGPGKAISYAFKYALLKTFCLETGDDPERDSIPHVLSEQQLKEIRKKIKETESDESAMCSWLGVESLESAAANSYDRIIIALNKKANSGS